MVTRIVSLSVNDNTDRMYSFLLSLAVHDPLGHPSILSSAIRSNSISNKYQTATCQLAIPFPSPASANRVKWRLYISNKNIPLCACIGTHKLNENFRPEKVILSQVLFIASSETASEQTRKLG